MGSIRRYTTPIAAQEAAQALRAAGIIATVVSEADALSGMGVQSGPGRFAVLIHDPARRDEALRILADLDLETHDPEPGWEAAADAPDLSRLHPALGIRCPACAHLLPRDASLTACPVCRAAVDPVAIVLASHGPEALDDCYPDPALDPTPDEAVDAAPLFCARCRYPLAGLPQVSQCPECGLPYSKRRMLREQPRR